MRILISSTIALVLLGSVCASAADPGEDVPSLSPQQVEQKALEHLAAGRQSQAERLVGLGHVSRRPRQEGGSTGEIPESDETQSHLPAGPVARAGVEGRVCATKERGGKERVGEEGAREEIGSSRNAEPRSFRSGVQVLLHCL